LTGEREELREGASKEASGKRREVEDAKETKGQERPAQL